MSIAALVSSVDPAVMRAVNDLARRDATRTPLRTPCLDRWRGRGDRASHDTLWRAACWEAAALVTDDPDRRSRCFAFSRLEVASARGDRMARAA